jgi:hypothetical protein
MGIFDDLANTKLNDVERPKNIPEGHYLAMFGGMWAENKAKTGNVSARFPLRLVAPQDDVDAEELAQAGGLPAQDKQKYTFDFWLSPESLYRFTEFAKAMGVPDSMNLVEALEHVGTSGDTFVITVKHRPDPRNPENVYLDFSQPVPEAN